MIEEEVQRPVLTSDDTGAGLSVSGHPAIRSTLYSTPTSSFLDRLLLTTAVSFALSLYVPYKLERLPYIKINLVSIGQSATNKINQNSVSTLYPPSMSDKDTYIKSSNTHLLARWPKLQTGLQFPSRATNDTIQPELTTQPLNQKTLSSFHIHSMHRPLPAPDPRSQASNSRLKHAQSEQLLTGAKPSLPSPHRPQPFFSPQFMVTQASTQLRQWFQQEFKGRREDTVILPPLPPPAFPAITEYYPTSVVPAGMCSFPENSGASPPSTRLELETRLRAQHLRWHIPTCGWQWNLRSSLKTLLIAVAAPINIFSAWAAAAGEKVDL
ncbi:hypothetical protein CPC08DRAFT_730539 [Agrocybe pediades]|nr:hypothetical protein CPC08DRAFT_730539 [Agrocybe pediades]